MPTEHSNMTTEFSPPMNGASPRYLTQDATSGHPAPVSPAIASAKPVNEVKLFSADSIIAKFSRTVDPLQRDVSRAIAEAIDQVAIPAAWRAAGRVLSKAEYQDHGLMEQAAGKGRFGQSVEFYWRKNPADGMKGFRTIALMVVTETEDGKVLIEAEAAPHLAE